MELNKDAFFHKLAKCTALSALNVICKVNAITSYLFLAETVATAPGRWGQIFWDYVVIEWNLLTCGSFNGSV